MTGDFDGVLFETDTGPGAWTFVSVPDDCAPDAAGPFGRSPVIAVVDGREWRTSIWRDSRRGWLLAVPRRIRREKIPGDLVHVRITTDESRQ